MRTSRGTWVMTTGAVLAVLTGFAVSSSANAPSFSSPREALKQGISAFNGGYYEIAIPALEHAAERNEFLAQFFLARLYADNRGVHTDHAKAYMLYKKIANDHADADPDDVRRAPYVAHALTALAGYVRLGLPEIKLRPNPSAAAEYLHHAATFFNHENAQFELAKLQLKGEGVPSNEARGKHWLAILAQKGHAGAQAFLADLYSRGMFVKKDRVRALTLISVAVKNAPAHDRVWIEDIYQNIYCGTPTGVRKQVGGMVAVWDQRYGRKPRKAQRGSLDELEFSPVRTCQNGEKVPAIGPKTKASQLIVKAPDATSGGADTSSGFVQRSKPEVMRGGAASGFRNVGETR